MSPQKSAAALAKSLRQAAKQTAPQIPYPASGPATDPVPEPSPQPTGFLSSINWRAFIGYGLITFAALTLINHYLGGGGFFGPTASSAYIVTIDDFKQRTTDSGQQLAQFLNDGDYWSKLEAAGHTYRQLDSNHPTATQPYAAHILSQGLPLMIFMSNDPPTKGVILWEGKIPTGPPADVEKFVDGILSQRIKK